MATLHATPAAAPTGTYPEGRVGGWNFQRDWTFLVPAILLSLMMVGAALMYLTSPADVDAEFTKLGFPVWVRPVLAVAKLSAVAAIWLSPWASLRHFAYAGLLFNFILAVMAHGAAGDGEMGGAAVALVLLGIVMWREPRG